MNKVTGIIIGVVAVLFVGVAGWALIQKSSESTDMNKYDNNAVIDGNDANGQIADHVKGNANASILIFEYADYQCSGCASVSGSVDELVKKYGDKIGIVQRSYILQYHQNGKAAASATEAAAKQGHWADYGTLLFKNQSEWFYSDSEKRTTQFKDYFTKITKGKGDMEKFDADMNSKEVAAKLKFDEAMSKKAGDIPYTPAFFMDGKLIDWANNAQSTDTPYRNTDKSVGFLDYMSKLIDQKLKEQKEKK